MEPIGIYVHVPFCKSVCPYCDFYSFSSNAQLRMDGFTDAIFRLIPKLADEYEKTADTLYFGGGTPSFLGAKNLSRLIGRAQKYFGLENAEITVECNPSSTDKRFLETIYRDGANRLSFGLQSAVPIERRILDRQTSPKKIENLIHTAKEIGFDNISLDVMLGIPKQTSETLNKTLQYVIEQDIQHVSIYMLILEEGTPFYVHQASLGLPDDDIVSDFYLQTCETLKLAGFNQYELSNFSKEGKESKHNLKYWNGEEYLGIGPSAHSFMNGERFAYEKDVDAFIRGDKPTEEKDTGGDFDEYVMLRLRLNEGLTDDLMRNRFMFPIPPKMMEKAHAFEKDGYVTTKNGIALTPRGFLISNTIIAELLSV